MQENVLVVLVGVQKSQGRGSALLKAPRDEYTAAVECLRTTSPFYADVQLRQDEEDVLDGCVLETAEDSALAQELLQKGPADAQGQQDDNDSTGAEQVQGEAEDTQKDAPADPILDRES